MQNTAQKVIEGLDYLRSTTHKARLEAEQVKILLALSLIDQAKGITLQDLEKATQCGQSMVSRNIHAFGAKSVGKRIIDLRLDPLDPRYRIASLSRDGSFIMEKFIGIIEGTTEVSKAQRKVKDSRAK